MKQAHITEIAEATAKAYTAFASADARSVKTTGAYTALIAKVIGEAHAKRDNAGLIAHVGTIYELANKRGGEKHANNEWSAWRNIAKRVCGAPTERAPDRMDLPAYPSPRVKKSGGRVVGITLAWKRFDAGDKDHEAKTTAKKAFADWLKMPSATNLQLANEAMEAWSAAFIELLEAEAATPTEAQRKKLEAAAKLRADMAASAESRSDANDQQERVKLAANA